MAENTPKNANTPKSLAEVVGTDDTAVELDAAQIAALQPENQPAPVQVTAEDVEASRAAAQKHLEAYNANATKTYAMDETVPGGVFIKNGMFVNSAGVPIVPNDQFDDVIASQEKAREQAKKDDVDRIARARGLMPA